jgi:hypothetical protein
MVGLCPFICDTFVMFLTNQNIYEIIINTCLIKVFFWTCGYDMIWYDMIWYDMIWYDMIWYDMIWYDMIWYDMIWYDMICIILICIYLQHKSRIVLIMSICKMSWLCQLSWYELSWSICTNSLIHVKLVRTWSDMQGPPPPPKAHGFVPRSVSFRPT